MPICHDNAYYTVYYFNVIRALQRGTSASEGEHKI